MVEIEIDGKTVQVAEGSMVIEAARRLGVYIPHFCYHKKLSIAANCRMCLVEVEKAPKPLPACATPVAAGMRVQTHSQLAVRAQKGVMEFLLINHPLDCPICDQGGECQLQDLSVGYGAGASRYVEEKRVVSNKDMGPLIATEMTRCIYCTRCVRFTQEIAGIREIGQANRGEHSEILPFIESTVDNELSGNIIDLCPVGALTSKPFRFSARTWELARRKSVSPHDSHGANLIVQVKHGRVYRVLPLENEEVNECWLSDKDRFAYEGLNSPERLERPMLKQCGEWRETDWQTALEYVATDLRRIAREHGAAALGALASPHATLEELYLLQKLLRGLGSENIDHRLRQSDFSLDGRGVTPWLGLPIAGIAALDRVLVIGSFLRKDHPLLAHRLRQAAKKATRVSLLHAADDEQLIDFTAKSIVAPAALPLELAGIVKALAVRKGAAVDAALAAVEPSAAAEVIAASLAEAVNGAIFLGNFARQHPRAALLHALAQRLAELTGARLGYFGEAANSAGGHVARAVPGAGGLDAAAMLAQPRRAYLLLHAEPRFDCADPPRALAALGGADLVVALTPFRTQALDHAHVLLPVAPFSETSGSFINTEGRVQGFNAAAKPLGETRPGWKVLRVLGNLLELDGFAHDSSEVVREEALGGKADSVAERLENHVAGLELDATALEAVPSPGLERIADVPIHFADPIVRRAPALQKTRDAAPPAARMNGATLERLGLKEGMMARLAQAGTVVLPVVRDEGVPDNCVRVAAAHEATAALGPLHGAIRVTAA
ncbi:MAG TPA: NADH-quinone oxidoreductase subunit NuoG [Candidatus Desulfobacillus sp.]|nr:NADH-quinone oxidoreductase subunit NuoG [Candidatus Desulfobacillus sp.]